MISKGLANLVYKTPRTADMDLLHPKARESFIMLEYKLESAFKNGTISVWFRPFETYRHPARQREALIQRTTRADMYESAHNFGLAVDFVPWNNGRWSWDPQMPWQKLRDLAKSEKLLNELDWDRAHVEHPYWSELRNALELSKLA